ncbi:hypothetical protein QWZ13_08845 [Reinekea marina]|uniref:Uncharacterized protein n=1 Tax=Reinekea marina TaxID=1310421 RepID=A0ABV7WV86_9GAMM|nr:hypothetical protein [Reinekea marina]MDN3649015.1 hypothetical protein [Reinekea marina]
MKPTLFATAIILGLMGCNSEDSNTESLNKQYSMTSLPEGFQTFSEADSTNRGTLRSTNEPVYVFKSLTNGSTDIKFYSSDGEEITSIDTPKILDIRDINQNYAAINIENIDITVGTENYSGNYTLIYDKKTGSLYPLIENNTPIEYRVDAEHEYWYTDTRFSNIADTSKLYFRHTDAKSLHIAELNEGAFIVTKIFDDYAGYLVVDKDGTILRKNWSGGDFIWVDPETLEQTTLAASTDVRPFLINGQLHGYNQTDNNIYELDRDGLNLTLTSSPWTTEEYRVSSYSVKRGNYEMTDECNVFQFNQDTKTIAKVASENQTAGGRKAAAAGNNTLFCLFGGTTDNSTPKFAAFNLNELKLELFNASNGTTVNAGERLSVVSDHELMFYDNTQGTLTEYYIKIDGTEYQKENSTGRVNVIRHLRN